MTSATYIFIFGICKLSIYFYIHTCAFVWLENLELALVEKKTIVCIADGFYKYTRFRRMIYTVKILALL